MLMCSGRSDPIPSRRKRNQFWWPPEYNLWAVSLELCRTRTSLPQTDPLYNRMIRWSLQ